MTENEFQIMLDNDLSFEEYIFLKMLYLSKTNDNIKNKLQFYVNRLINSNYQQYRKLLQYLEDLNFIRYYISDNKNINNIEILPKFINLVFIERNEAWKELLDIYPVYGYINNKKVNLLLFKDEKAKNYYYNYILKGGQKELHNKFIEIVKFHFAPMLELNTKIPTISSDNNCIGLEKFLYSWDAFIRTFIKENSK